MQTTNDALDRVQASIAQQGATEAKARGQQIQEMITKQKPAITRALANSIDTDHFLSAVFTSIRQNPKLMDCSAVSLVSSLIKCATLGLMPGVMGEAYLVPYKDECTLIVGYQGLLSLIRRSGATVSVNAQIVREGDEFDFEFGLDEKLRHRPASSGRGSVRYVYAYATLKDGGRVFEVMTFEDIERIRARSKSGQNGPWVTDWEQMARKTAIRRLSNYLPKSVKMMELQQIEHDNGDGLADAFTEAASGVRHEGSATSLPPLDPTGEPVPMQTQEIPQQTAKPATQQTAKRGRPSNAEREARSKAAEDPSDKTAGFPIDEHGRTKEPPTPVAMAPDPVPAPAAPAPGMQTGPDYEELKRRALQNAGIAKPAPAVPADVDPVRQTRIEGFDDIP